MESSLVVSQVGDWLKESYHYAPGPSIPTEPHAHRKIQVTWSSHFDGYYLCGSQKIEFRKGQIVILPSWVGHSCHGYQERDAWSNFNVSYIDPETFFASDIAFANPVVWEKEVNWSEATLEDLLLDQLPESPLPLTCGEFKRAERRIRENPAWWPQTGELAMELGYSPRHLYRIIRAATGLSPSQWIRSEKLELALQKIRIGRTYREAAETCGFYDEQHLRRVFRKTKAIPLSALRR